MRRAFERNADAAATEMLPERPISQHPNFVTSAGLGKIDARVGELEVLRSAALAAGDLHTLAAIERDLRYWKQRRGSARVVAPPATPLIVRFGVTVHLRFDDDSVRSFQIVGEDEAEPAAGLLSWTSPVGSALIGCRRDEVLQAFGRNAAIAGMQA
jgi:transcription elongation GreA/GreB family factor